MSKKRNHKHYIIVSAVTSFILLAAVLSGILYSRTALQRSDFRRIASESFDTAFLSMYPIDTFSEADFTYYRGMTLFRADNMLSGVSGIKRYLKRIEQSQNQVSTVYLGLIPEKTDLSGLASLIQSYPAVSFECILACPNADYWRQLSRKQYSRALNLWKDFLTDAAGLLDARFYFYAAEEWLVTNPALYTDYYHITPDAAAFLSTNSDYLHPYLLTAENAAEWGERLEHLTADLRSDNYAAFDLQDTAVIFFGDSVIGNYTDGMSVPGVVKGLSGAAVYNCGYGGNSAALGPETDISLPGITEAFFAGDLSAVPEDKQIYQGFLSCFQNPPAGKRICYVISYGLNDYLEGYPVSSDDPFDITTYTGAIRTAVATIRENDGDACILLCTPSWSGYTLKESQEPGAVHLQTYADAALSLAEELQVIAVDNYYTLGIDSSNYTEYLSDLIHPNEQGRYLIALKIMEAIP